MARLLVIDDDPLVLRSLDLMLQDAGHTVVTARDGRVALREFGRHDVAMVITDLIMPEMEGIETIRALRRLRPDLKIIAISGGFQFGRHRIPVLDMAAQLGADHVLRKPFAPRELLSLVDACLNAGA